MKINKRVKLIFFISLGILLVSGISVYATSTYIYNASEVKYSDEKSVADALNELYEIKNLAPVKVGGGVNSYSSGVTTETKITGTVYNNEILEIKDDIFTVKKDGYYLIIYVVGSDVLAEEPTTYTGWVNLYVNDEFIDFKCASFASYDIDEKIVKLKKGDTLYATYYGDGSDYQKKSQYDIFYLK